ncbi:Sec-independent protein translocase protein TatB [Andreprevotia sp. IGB-42]|uniref:Sec-independent protein translocase protein TatB n=1 Tax=Andreprevotia sp. IGB-42 TaxID=2497473 RepID=UPI0013578DDB|nr:Sec-independent protein translocase protein TatB [Andreprevotia sp. IGB-42]KAF0814662.1 Sec-independent protein translocase protein TatB [Andreprevotia sp. IGB-42]
MFDVSFGELVVVGAVALVVLGPERLPRVARTVGALIGRAQRFVTSVKADLDREMHQTELARIEAELRAEGDDLRNTIHQSVVAPVRQAHSDFTDFSRPVHAEVEATAALLQAPVHTVLADEAPAPLLAAPIDVPVDDPGGDIADYPADMAADVVPALLAPVVDERQLDLFAPPPAPVAIARDRR